MKTNGESVRLISSRLTKEELSDLEQTLSQERWMADNFVVMIKAEVRLRAHEKEGHCRYCDAKMVPTVQTRMRCSEDVNHPFAVIKS